MAELKLGRCPRCKAHGLVADAQGLRYALDIAPVDAIGFGRSIARGVGLLWVVRGPGGLLKLTGAYGGPGSPTQPSWAAGGAQGPSASGAGQLHAEHSCGASARDMVILNVQRPCSAPATPGSHRGGPRQPDAPAGSLAAPARPSPAPPATRRPSDSRTAARSSERLRAMRCNQCNRLIDRSQPHVAIEFDTYRWGVHDECP